VIILKGSFAMFSILKTSIITILSMLLLGADLHAMSPLVLKETLFAQSSTVGHSQAFVDKSASLSAEDVYREHWNTFEDVESSAKVLENGALWIKLEITNQSQQEIVAYMQYLKALAGSIELYQIEGNKPKLVDRTGYLYPWNDRQVKARLPTFRLTVNPGEHVFLMRAFHPNGGGVPAPRSLILFNQDEFIESMRNDTILSSIIQGIIAFALVYNFFVFLTLRHKHYLNYIFSMFFLYLAATIGNAADINSYIFKDRPLFTTYIYASMGIGILGPYFFTVYTVEFLKTWIYAPTLHRWLKIFQVFLLSLIAVYFIEVLFFKSIFITMVGLVCASIPLSIVFTMVGIQGVRRGYRPSWYYLVAYAALTVGNTVNILQQTGAWEYNYLHEWYVSVSICVQSSLLSLGLGDRVKFESEEASTKIQSLNDELKVHIEKLDELVAEKTNKIRYIMDHINIGILKINNDGQIDADHSKACEKIFDKQDLEKLKMQDLIWEERDLNSEKAQLLNAAIVGSMGENEISFEANAHCYPLELEYRGRQLELEWAAIVENSLICGYLVSIKDVTYIKNLERERHENLEEVKSLMNMTRFKKERVYEYIISELKMVDASLLITHDDAGLDEKTKVSNLAIILRNLHTIKGNARTYGLDEGSNLIHECESAIIGLKSYNEKMKCAIQGMKGIESILRRQLSIIEKYFPSIKKDIMDTDDRVAGYINAMEKINYLYPAAAVANYVPCLPDIAAYLRQNNGATFDDILEPIKNDIPRLCEKLHKPEPKILVHSHGIFIRKVHVSSLRSVLNHLMRNSLDHGLETASESKQVGEASLPIIEINLQYGDEYYVLRYSDNGRGLDLEKVVDKAREMGLDESHSILEAMRNIFVSRLSTKDKVSDISGRGIGLDAVRDVVNTLNGHIDIRLFQENVDENAPVSAGMGKLLAFEFVMLLPREIFL